MARFVKLTEAPILDCPKRDHDVFINPDCVQILRPDVGNKRTEIGMVGRVYVYVRENYEEVVSLLQSPTKRIY